MGENKIEWQEKELEETFDEANEPMALSEEEIDAYIEGLDTAIEEVEMIQFSLDSTIKIDGKKNITQYSGDLINPSLPIVTEYDEKYDKASIDVVISAANQNDLVAIYELACRYRVGVDGVEKDLAKACNLYKEVLKKQNNRDAFFYVGYMLEQGVCGNEQSRDCLQYYLTACKLKSSRAASQLASLYEYGNFVSKDLTRALDYCNMAIDFGNGDRCERSDKARVYEKMGKMDLAQKSWEEALEYYESLIINATEEDTVWIYREMGSVCEHLGNCIKAKEYYEQVLKYKNDAEAASSLGAFYEEGISGYLEPDLEKAHTYYQLAYDNKYGDYRDIMPAYLLAVFYFNEFGGKGKDYKAFELFKEVQSWESEEADLYKESNLFLGFYYGFGIPGYVEINTDKAFELLDNVVESDEAKALYYRGIIYLKILHDELSAKQYLEAAAKKGSNQAQDFLRKISIKEKAADQHKQSQINLIEASIDDLIEEYNNGNRKVTFMLADAYARGKRGVEKNLDLALKYYFEVINYDSTELGTGHAYYSLASRYLSGDLVQKDYSKALEYAQKSLNYTKLPSSYVLISQIYALGLGVSADYDKALVIAKEGIKETDDGLMYSWYARLLCIGTVGDEKELEVEECLEKCLERTPLDKFANRIVGQLYMKGCGKKYKYNISKAIECLEISGEAQDFRMIGDILSDEKYNIRDFRKAVEYYKKAWEMGDILAAALIAGTELLTEHANETWIDGSLGVRAGKEYIFNGKNNDLRIMCFFLVVQYLKQISHSYREYCVQQCGLIFNEIDKLNFQIETEKQKNRLVFCMSNIIGGALSAVNSEEGWLRILSKTEGIMEHDQVMNYACREVVGRNYCNIGKRQINNGSDLALAKYCFEKSILYGCEEGQILSARIKKNLFGKWSL